MIFKKILFLLCFSILFSTISFGQYFVEKKDLIEKKIVFNDTTYVSFIEEISYNDSLYCKGILKRYDKNGRQLLIIESEDISSRKEGIFTTFYKNGKLKRISKYTNKGLDSQRKTFYENGNLKMLETYKNDTIIQKHCYTFSGKDTICPPFEILPQFPGGNVKFQTFINSNLNYPKKDLKNNVAGKLILSFIIDENGNTIDPKIIQSVSESIDNVGIKLIKKMPKWTPGIQDGEYVKVKMTIPLNFRLSDP